MVKLSFIRFSSASKLSRNCWFFKAFWFFFIGFFVGFIGLLLMFFMVFVVFVTGLDRMLRRSTDEREEADFETVFTLSH